MKQITVHAAKTNLSALIRKVEAGGEVVIARGDKPVARLVPITEKRPRRRFGVLRGKAKVGSKFFEPLPEHELKAWE